MVRIVVSGPPGSGKTTQAKKIAERYGLSYFSAGAIFRRVAQEKGLSLEELSILAMHDPRIDLEIDRATLEAAKEDNIVIDGHLAAWIVADLVDLRIYMTAPLPLRVMRIAGRDGVSLEKALFETLIREYTQRKRFLEYYGLDVTDTSIFDIVINTKKIGPEEAFNMVAPVIERLLAEKGELVPQSRRNNI